MAWAWWRRARYVDGFIEKARVHSLGAVAVRNSGHLGLPGITQNMAVEAGWLEWLLPMRGRLSCAHVWRPLAWAPTRIALARPP